MAAQPSTSAPTTFPDLPENIRIKIWTLALSVTRPPLRIFEMKFPASKRRPFQLVRKSCPVRLPVLDHVNQEARRVVLANGYDLVTLGGNSKGRNLVWNRIRGREKMGDA